MSPTHVELYEALKPSIGEEAARMIAEVVPPTRDLATKADVDALAAATKADVAVVVRQIEALRGELRSEMHSGQASLLKWMIAMFVPVWLGSWGTVVAVLLEN